MSRKETSGIKRRLDSSKQRMHRYKTAGQIHNIRLAAIYWLVGFILVGASPFLAILELLSYIPLPLTFLAALCIGGIAMVTSRSLSKKARCPLCRGALFVRTGAKRAHNAKKLLGSVRNRVAFELLFTGKTRCPHCSEPIQLKIRESRSGHSTKVPII